MLKDMVTSSVLTRLMAIIVLSLVMLAAITVATIDLVAGREVPQVIIALLSIGLGAAANMVGVNFGVVLQPLKEKEPITDAKGD